MPLFSIAGQCETGSVGQRDGAGLSNDLELDSNLDPWSVDDVIPLHYTENKKQNIYIGKLSKAVLQPTKCKLTTQLQDLIQQQHM